MAKKNLSLDNFFREKLSGYEAPEKKGNWQLLNHLLEARERRRRIIRRILLMSFFLVVMVLSFLIFIPGNEKSKNVVNDNKNDRSFISSAPVTDSTDNKNKITDSHINSLPEKNKDRRAVQDNIKETTPEGTSSAQAEIINKPPLTKKNKESHTKVARTQSEKRSSIAKVDINVSRKEDVNSQGGNAKAGEEDAKITDAILSSTEKAENKDSTVINSHTHETAVKDSIVGDSSATGVATNDSLNSPVEDTVKLKDRNTGFFSFNLSAGLNLYRTQSTSLTDERNISPLVGVELMHPVSQHFTIGLGTLYSLQGGYHLADTSTQVSYFLERNVSQQIILIRKQHKLYIPFTLYYIISNKHAVSCGIHWSYLVNTVGDYTEINKISGNTTQSKENNVKGYMDGIKSSAFSFSAGYRFSLSKRFDINTRIIQELTDSYTPQYFYGISTAPSWSLQTYVSIKF